MDYAGNTMSITNICQELYYKHISSVSCASVLCPTQHYLVPAYDINNPGIGLSMKDLIYLFKLNIERVESGKRIALDWIAYDTHVTGHKGWNFVVSQKITCFGRRNDN